MHSGLSGSHLPQVIDFTKHISLIYLQISWSSAHKKYT